MRYKGNRWYKCDLHLHTIASKCFQDRSVTPEQWVARAIEQGLNCVAVTDHNTGAGIDLIKSAAIDKDITIFPGVEITCDTSKVHLLIIFDPTKSTTDVEDFLIKCDIRREDFGEQDAFTSKSIFEVSQIAYDDGALVIPAHIDEYNGLGSISVSNLKDFFALERINAVQVVHKEFFQSNLNTLGNTELKTILNEYYNNPRTGIDDSTLKEWYTPVKYAIESNLAILTFSDNPHEPKNSKHGLAGIGSHYTWIKMDEAPSLEGLRQAFLLPQFRIKNKFDCPGTPYTEPELWIKSIIINNTTITDPAEPLSLEFSPQMNAIIGGRGSGKSSILRFIRGVFNRIKDLESLPDILNDHANFYKTVGGRTQIGVFHPESTIQVLFIRRGIQYKISVNNINNSTNQNILVESFNDSDSTWQTISDEGFIDFFAFEQYSQKQIFEIAQQPNALRGRIDSSIPQIEGLINLRNQIKNRFFEKSASVRTISQLVDGKGRLITKIRDIDNSLQKLENSGIADLLKRRNNFILQEKVLIDYIEVLQSKVNMFSYMLSELSTPNFDLESFETKYQEEIRNITNTFETQYAGITSEVEKQKEELLKLIKETTELLDKSQWRTDYNLNFQEFGIKKAELEAEGINDIENFERFSEERIQLDIELKDIQEKETRLLAESTERSRLQAEYLTLSKEITSKRKEFIVSVIQGDKIKILIKPFRNKVDFHNRLREILQRESGFEESINSVIEMLFNGNIENNLNLFRKLILDIRSGAEIDFQGIDGHFKNLLMRITDPQIDELELIVPEDEIEVQYKPTASAAFKSLSTASAGQKTTAILTYLLSHGDIPLILDQPEDDLDNRLVYELIVERLKQAKEYRQIIVVTHNANIPVNGDAELIISMNSDSKLLNVFHSGTVEQPHIKKEICDVMEGTEQAFEMRSRRYKHIRSQ